MENTKNRFSNFGINYKVNKASRKKIIGCTVSLRKKQENNLTLSKFETKRLIDAEYNCFSVDTDII